MADQVPRAENLISASNSSSRGLQEGRPTLFSSSIIACSNSATICGYKAFSVPRLSRPRLRVLHTKQCRSVLSVPRENPGVSKSVKGSGGLARSDV